MAICACERSAYARKCLTCKEDFSRSGHWARQFRSRSRTLSACKTWVGGILDPGRRSRSELALGCPARHFQCRKTSVGFCTKGAASLEQALALCTVGARQESQVHQGKRFRSRSRTLSACKTWVGGILDPGRRSRSELALGCPARHFQCRKASVGFLHQRAASLEQALALCTLGAPQESQVHQGRRFRSRSCTLSACKTWVGGILDPGRRSRSELALGCPARHFQCRKTSVGFCTKGAASLERALALCTVGARQESQGQACAASVALGFECFDGMHAESVRHNLLLLRTSEPAAFARKRFASSRPG